ncbi:MAG TPA: ribbon-helix-helix protein, CopG family [Acidobacteriaceae bacterium]|nr:ribbon-helix-helix protein, CopG family [Acidobacteriaceae bacterium]
MADSGANNLSEAVQRIAAARGVSPNVIVREAVEEYVERREKQEAFHADALAAWEHYRSTGLHVSGEEADDWLGRLEAGESAAPPECHR